MSNIIELLPNHVANQIAAGEVIQRPASVVKELMENSIDAGSKNVQLIVKDSGKSLIQVVDDGKGMSDIDARMCFERHATSKIRVADDLFNLHTKGFRGEALASIAAIAHVELKTCQEGQELGTCLIMEGSEVKSQDKDSMNHGTNFMVKNLFYNVPARRNFLKSDRVEFRFIMEEFYRLVLAHPNVGFTLHHNGKEQYRLPASTLRQRIVNIYGTRYNQRLVPLEEQTDIVSIEGFMCKPEFAKKSRGEQFYFVNDRFIKSSYLHHALTGALEGVIQGGLHPSYFIFLTIDPDKLDVNIHPTKTEIKFEDEKAIYAILRSTIRKSLGQYNIAPSLDFDTNQDYDVSPLLKNSSFKQPKIVVNPDFNPFDIESPSEKVSAQANKDLSFSTRFQHAREEVGQEDQKPDDWKAFYKIEESDESTASSEEPMLFESLATKETHQRVVYQLHNKYILSPLKSGYMMIHQQRSHERILFEKFQNSVEKSNALCQQLLFPQEIQLPKSDLDILKELQKEIESLGFDLGEIGAEKIEIHGVPFETPVDNITAIIEKVLEDYKTYTPTREEQVNQIARSLAKSMCIKTGKSLDQKEMNHLIDELFACQFPQTDPNGRPTHITVSLEEIDKNFA